MPVLFIYLLIFLFPLTVRDVPEKTAFPADQAAALFNTLGLADKGLTYDAFNLALKGRDRLLKEGILPNPGILTIADLSQSSRNKRLYVIDLINKCLLFNTYVAHGRNTGEEYARNFSNAAGSYKSSLGFYVTREEMVGSSVGLSLVLDGVEKGINDNAVRRAIIMHGADYATEEFIRKYGRLGRSFGCPSLPPELIKPVIETIKEGTCLFIYSNSNQYLSQSKLLNQASPDNWEPGRGTDATYRKSLIQP
jgi:hypothetical protein